MGGAVATDDQRKRRAPDRVHPVHRHDLGRREAPDTSELAIRGFRNRVNATLSSTLGRLLLWTRSERLNALPLATPSAT
jgi:hypothetical protein